MCTDGIGSGEARQRIEPCVEELSGASLAGVVGMDHLQFTARSHVSCRESVAAEENLSVWLVGEKIHASFEVCHVLD